MTGWNAFWKGLGVKSLFWLIVFLFCSLLFLVNVIYDIRMLTFFRKEYLHEQITNSNSGPWLQLRTKEYKQNLDLDSETSMFCIHGTRPQGTCGILPGLHLRENKLHRLQQQLSTRQWGSKQPVCSRPSDACLKRKVHFYFLVVVHWSLFQKKKKKGKKDRKAKGTFCTWSN